jgi:putative hydrolase
MPMTNKQIARLLEEAADLLQEQGANRFRVAAFRRAAETIRTLHEEAESVLQSDGFEGLTVLPGIGPAIGGAIVEIVKTGRWSQLDRLRGAFNPEKLLTRIPGIGPKLAHTILTSLHIDSLEALETAAHDGTLDSVPGFGSRRTAMVRAALGEVLARPRTRAVVAAEPDAALLLDVDREYREKDAAGKLLRIAPKRFNPKREAWLPILHTERGPWQFTVLYSNTALAHQLGRTRDWVIVYFHTDTQTEGQRTIVTETHGALHGRRVVRGREQECENYYAPTLAWEPASNNPAA